MKTCSLLQFAASASYYHHHHSERSLSQWKERVLFLPSTLALFPQLWSLFKHQHTLPSATMSIQLATKITSVRPMLRQRGIRSQYPELWHLRERLIWPQYPQKPFILRISSVALHWCNKGSYRVSLLSCEMLVGRFQPFLKLPIQIGQISKHDKPRSSSTSHIDWPGVWRWKSMHKMYMTLLRENRVIFFHFWQ